MIQGTIKTLLGKVALNGKTLNETKLRAFLTLGNGDFVKELGTLPSNGKRGRPQIVYQVNESVRAKFGVVDGKTVEAVEYVPAEA